MPINQNRNNNNKTQIDTNYAHLQPQAVELEKVVLGALMIDTDAFSVVSEMLKPQTFYDPRHQKIYEAIQTMNMEERPVDIMTVTDELTKMGAIEKIGGAGYLMDFFSFSYFSFLYANVRLYTKRQQPNVFARSSSCVLLG